MTQQTAAPGPPSTGPSGTDPRPLLLRAVDQAVRVIGRLGPADLALPTPCPEYDVRSLAGHVISVLRRVTAVAGGAEAVSVPPLTAVADGELSAVAAADARLLAEAWADASVLDRMLVLPFGTMPGRAAALAYTQEFTVHAWDLAVAVGRAADLDDELAVASDDTARRFLPAEQRGGPVPFGPVVEVPPDAAPYARLVGWLGRDPAWAPPAA